MTTRQQLSGRGVITSRRGAPDKQVYLPLRPPLGGNRSSCTLVSPNASFVDPIQITKEKAEPDLCSPSVSLVQCAENPKRTPLGLAAEKGDIHLVEALIKSGCRADEKDGFEETALFLAAGAGQTHMVHYLLENHDVDVNTSNWDGYTPLIWAVARGHLRTARVLVQHFADVNAQTRIGWRALHFAAMNSREDILHFLLQQGAYVRIRNKFGCSASYAAATPQMRETLMKLETCELRNKAQVHKSAAMTGSRVLDSNSKVLSNAEQNELAVEMDSIRDRADKAVPASPWPYSLQLLRHSASSKAITSSKPPNPGDLLPHSFPATPVATPASGFGRYATTPSTMTPGSQTFLTPEPAKGRAHDIYRYDADSDNYRVFRIDYKKDGSKPQVFNIASPSAVLSGRAELYLAEKMKNEIRK